MTTQKIADAVEAYRSSPDAEGASRLAEALSEASLFVPVGDFDGRNAALSFIEAREGGSYIPLYTRRDLVPEGQAAEEVGPADWMHILEQLPDVVGYAVNPYTATNFAFTRDFVEAVLACGRARGEDEEAEVAPPDVEEAPAPVEEAPSALASEDTPDGTLFKIGEPNGVPASLEQAMQKVADTTGMPVWLLFVVPSRGENSYLMVIDGEEEWFEASGAKEINEVLSHFDDPGLALDFVIRDSELGAFVRDREPHYVPAVAQDDSAADSAADLPDEAESAADAEPVADAEPAVDVEPVADDGEPAADEGSEAEVEPAAEAEPAVDMAAEDAAEPAPEAGAGEKNDAAGEKDRVEETQGSEPAAEENEAAGGLKDSVSESGEDEMPIGPAYAGMDPGAFKAENSPSESGTEAGAETEVRNAAPREASPEAEGASRAQKIDALAAKARDVGGKAAGQARVKAEELGAQMRERIADAQSNSDDAKSFVKRLFGRG